MKEPIHITISLDDNYFIPAFLFLNSVIETNKNEEICFHILFSKLTSINIEKIKALSNALINFSFYEVNLETLKNCPIRINDHVSIATYFRLLLPVLIPESIHKVLYFDCDMLCFDSLRSLYDIDISNYSLGASLDSQCQNELRKKPLNLKSETNYFGAGSLIFNLDYWRENKLSNKCLSYIAENSEKLLWHDQDTLNAICEDSVKIIDFKYNFYETFFKNRTKSKMSDEQWKNVQENKNQIIILHYTQAEKPWFFECEHPLKKIWRQYYKKIFNHDVHLKFKYNNTRKKISFIKRKILSYIFRFPMNPNYEPIPLGMEESMKNRLGI